MGRVARQTDERPVGEGVHLQCLHFRDQFTKSESQINGRKFATVRQMDVDFGQVEKLLVNDRLGSRGGSSERQLIPSRRRAHSLLIHLQQRVFLQ